jgi:hypothetical protein
MTEVLFVHDDVLGQAVHMVGCNYTATAQTDPATHYSSCFSTVCAVRSSEILLSYSRLLRVALSLSLGFQRLTKKVGSLLYKKLFYFI